MFITNKERIGTCYLEFQFCKNDKPIKIVKVDIDIIDNWKEDSLLVSDDDFNEFYKLYGKIFECALFPNGKIGFFPYEINYYDKNNLQELYNKRKEQYTNNYETIKILEKEKHNLDKKIEDNKVFYRNLYEDKVKGTITEDMFCMMSADYLREIETMTKRIETIDNEIKSLEIVKEERKQADEILKKYKHIDKLNRVIVDEFIDKVYVGCYNKETKTRDIEIEWNIEF